MGQYKQFEHLNIFKDLPFDITFVNGNLTPKKKVIETLTNLNISNLAQLFEAYDNGAFNDGRKGENKNIKASIELLRFKYLQEDIIADVFLSEKIETEKVGVYDDSMSSKSSKKLRRLLGTDSAFILESYFNTAGNYKPRYFGEEYKARRSMKNISIFNLLRMFIEDTEYHNNILKRHLEGKWKNEKCFEIDSTEIQDILQRIELVIEYVALKSTKPLKEIDAIIKNRQKELERLQNQRRLLDIQIEVLEANISSLQEERGKIK